MATQIVTDDIIAEMEKASTRIQAALDALFCVAEGEQHAGVAGTLYCIAQTLQGAKAHVGQGSEKVDALSKQAVPA
jgi:hypothetical protein